jgi:hypothetical protein
MCECCPEPSRPRTPEEEAARAAVRARLDAMLEADLKRRGLTVDQLLDPDCYGGPLARKPSKVWKRIVLLGLTLNQIWIEFKLSYYRVRSS